MLRGWGCFRSTYLNALSDGILYATIYHIHSNHPFSGVLKTHAIDVISPKSNLCMFDMIIITQRVFAKLLE